MKFGKSIRREIQNHLGMHYIGYKELKRLIKQINKSRMEERCKEEKKLSEKFETMLHRDLRIIEKTFRRLFTEINNMKNEIEEKFSPHIFDNEEMKIEKKILSFDSLLDILKERGIMSQELFDFCVRLSLLSNKCKIIRTYVVYNYIGLLKILKKRQKKFHVPLQRQIICCGASGRSGSSVGGRISENAFDRYLSNSVTNIMGTYSWCLSNELPELISSINIISDEFMEHLCKCPISFENYICPICLCLINDPVTLNTCFHSFCWKCLATAIQKYSMDKCPSCRTKIVYDKDTFKIDGILCRFLKKHFPSAPEGLEAEEIREEGMVLEGIHLSKGQKQLAKTGLGTTRYSYYEDAEDIGDEPILKSVGQPEGESLIEQRSGVIRSSGVIGGNAAQSPSTPSVRKGEKEKAYSMTEINFAKYNPLDDIETKAWKDINLYLSVLNDVDENRGMDTGRESDSSNNEVHDNNISYESEVRNLEPKGTEGVDSSSFSIISDVISYTLS
ncbi:RING zinc finger protein [Plasmodium gonderi]|uniref:RING zinc finger protein n=1 Tax=Plasmodium gonderi TaxID=77519 RepID=A0A1Y1JB82_PLAGO|nr:RING zinc finger protein [Plasmodium gonderi]GAW79510.1 RING zinc finger protein [Plasmodium gonderi]